MDELEKEKMKIKKEAIKLRKGPVNNIRKEIKENYKMGIEYFKEVEDDNKY